MFRLGFVGLLAVLALLGGATLRPTPSAASPASPAPAGPSANPAWGLVSSPNPGTERNDLRGIWAAGTNDVWAAGFAAGDNGIEQTLMLHNTGGGWTVTPSPNVGPSDNYLFGISGSAATNIWAVGYALSNDGYQQPLTLHWNGSTWSSVPAATNGPGNYYLYGVAARAANDVWAVGTRDNQTLIEHWDGSAWTIVPSPNPSANRNVLAAVSADAANDAWAVGSLPDDNTALLLHWDGSAWTASTGVPAHNLYGVSARTANDVWAVGTAQPLGVYTLAMHWDGSTWTVVPTPNQGNYSILRAVAPLAANDVWAIGVYNVNDTGLRPFFLHWDGSAWTVTPGMIAGPEHNDFYGLAAVSTADVWAAGHYQALSTTTDRQTLVEHYCASCAPAGTPSPTPTRTPTRTPSPVPTPSCVPEGTRVPSPDHPSARWTELRGIGGSGPNDLWAVGYYDDLSVEAFTMHWDGSAWTEVPNPPHSLLASVTALSPSDAWAVGWRVQHWDGTSWTVAAAPGLDYYGVAAAAPNDVWAVGSGIAHWDGGAWSLVPSPSIGGLNGLTIVAPNNIWAAGSYCTGDLDPCRTLIEHWDGTSWRIVSSPNVGTEDNTLTSIAAVSASDIWAVGSDGAGGLVEHWDGTAWTVQPGPPFGPIVSLAAPAANNLWVISGGRVGHWDGTAWTVAPAQSYAGLNGIFARTPGDIWAVGYIGQHNPDTLTEHFTGACLGLPTATPSPVITPTATPTPDCATGWNVLAGPALPGNNVLRGVAVVARDDIWAVGGWGELIEHWDGSQWHAVPGGAPGAELFAVTALAANDVWAVGHAYSGFDQTVVDHWDGTAWTRVPSPNIYGAYYNQLFAISAHTATDIWAAGHYGPGANGRNQTLMLHWDGTQWRVVPTPNVGTGDNFLWGITSGTANDVWSAGSYASADGQPAQVLIEHWDGSAWTVSPTPDFSPYDSQLHSIVVVAPNDVWAVGSEHSQILVLHWDGSQWQPIAAPSPGGTSAFQGLAAVAPDSIWAVGWASGDQPIIQHWDGTAWASVAIPGIRGGSLQAVGVVNATDLWAVGNYFNESFYVPLIEHYTGPCTTVTPAPTRTASPTPTATRTPSPTSTATVPALASPTNPGASSTPAGPTVTPGSTSTPSPTATVCAFAFSDVPPNSPFYPYIRCLACRGILSGYSASPPCLAGAAPCFNGGATVTRGQVAKIVANAADYSDAIPSTQQTFTDVPYTNPFWLYVERASQHGVISGYSNSPPCPPGQIPCFLPFNNVTRGQIAKIDANAGGYADPIPSTQQTFSDVPSTNPFWLYIERAALHGAISGYSTSPPCPGGVPCFLWASAVTRGQAAKIVAQTFYPSCQTPARFTP